ncbi:MAG: hypothetical protein Q7S31_03905 [bacterium]|nr:hypothetical protein [bacterium]
MSESNEFPGNITQVQNFLKATGEVKIANVEYKAGGIQSGILYGLETLIPNEVKASGILTDPDRRKTVDDLLAFQVRLNDRIDFANAHRQETIEFTQDAILKEADAKTKLDASLRKVQSPELEVTIRDATAEVEAVEAYIASRKGNLSFDDIEKYRNIVNAISNCAVTRAILGPNYLADRLQTLPADKMNWQGIYDKYRWVLSSEPQNNVERTVQIMHNLGMAGQIDDDWYGRHIDQVMGIESFATASLDEKAHNPEQAKEFLDDIKSSYLTQAKRLGLNPAGAALIDGVQKRMQKVMNWVTRKARYSENTHLKEYLNTKVVPKMGIREKAFARGEI